MNPTHTWRPGPTRSHAPRSAGAGSRLFGTLGLILAGALALAVLTSSPSPATTVIQFGTVQLADLSDTVIRGTVTGIEARMHPEHQFIYTYVSVRVDEVFKGDPALAGRTITLEELGGQVGRLVQHVAAVPDFTENEDVLSFLENRPDGLYRTYGMVQGKFRFETDSRTGARILTRPDDLNEANLAGAAAVTDLTPARPDGNYEAEPLLAALRQLRDQK